MEIIRTENLTFTYPQNNIPTLKNVSVSINSGDFITVFGATGSGKSTFLKMLKKEISPLGKKEGKIFLENIEIENLSSEKSSFSVGYVMQRPEHQIVTDKVWHELAFGLENLNLPVDVMGRRIAEMASFFGIEEWFDKSVHILSGGQKQMLNLASVMVMNPKIIILDEPTSQLDPISAQDFISTLNKINKEFGITVIIAEHRLEELITISDKLLIFNEGEVLFFEETKTAVSKINNTSLMSYMPIPARYFGIVDGKGDFPLDIREGRAYVEKRFSEIEYKVDKNNKTQIKSEIALEFKDVYFKYDRKQKDILSGISFSVYKNEIFCILGGNGSGKSTTLSVASGIEKSYYGKVKIFDKIIKEYKNNELYNKVSVLPQDVQTVFTEDTVEKELKDFDSIPFFFSDYDNKKNQHPYDLSGGEQQLLAFSKILKKQSEILLLDEPTKGLDPIKKEELVFIIKQLKQKGKTIIIVTHDLEFAAECSDRCALLFQGKIMSVENSKDFFCGNSFYTTSVNKMTRGILNNIVTLDDLIKADRAFFEQKGDI